MDPFNNPFDSFGFIFTIGPIFIGLCFLLVFGVIILSIIRGIKTWNYNNSQPVLTVVAKIVAKRTDVSGGVHHGGNGHHHGHTRTTYYVTFEVESGDRLEFSVEDNEYGLLVEGDMGRLTFQGTRYLGFKRKGKE